MRDIRPAAIEYAAAQSKLRELRSNVRRCTEQRSPDYETGDSGSGRCDLYGDPEDMCLECRVKAGQLAAYKETLHKRALARARILRWAESSAKGADDGR